MPLDPSSSLPVRNLSAVADNHCSCSRFVVTLLYVCPLISRLAASIRGYKPYSFLCIYQSFFTLRSQLYFLFQQTTMPIKTDTSIDQDSTSDLRNSTSSSKFSTTEWTTVTRSAAWRNATTVRNTTNPSSKHLLTNKNPIKMINKPKTTTKINTVTHSIMPQSIPHQPGTILENNEDDNLNEVTLDDEVAFFTNSPTIQDTITEESFTNVFTPTHYTCYGQEGFQLLQEQIFPIIEQWTIANPDDQYTNFWTSCIAQGLNITSDFNTTLSLLQVSGLENYYHFLLNSPPLKSHFNFQWDNKIIYLRLSTETHLLPNKQTKGLPSHTCMTLTTPPHCLINQNL